MQGGAAPGVSPGAQGGHHLQGGTGVLHCGGQAVQDRPETCLSLKMRQKNSLTNRIVPYQLITFLFVNKNIKFETKMFFFYDIYVYYDQYFRMSVEPGLKRLSPCKDSQMPIIIFSKYYTQKY